MAAAAAAVEFSSYDDLRRSSVRPTDRPTQLTALALIGRAHRAGHPAIIELLQLSIGGRLGE